MSAGGSLLPRNSVRCHAVSRRQPTGRPIDPRADYGEWKELLATAGVREARLHDARHTAATFLLVLGASDRTAMDVMGWPKADMAKRYMHVPDELRRRIADQMGGLLWDQQDTKGQEMTQQDT